MKGEQKARELIGDLTPRQRTIVLLKANDYTEEQMASRLRVPKCVVTYEIAAIRRFLKLKLMEKG